MITGQKFIDKAKELFGFLTTEFDYKLLNEKNREGLFYDIEYGNENVNISISYENRENYLQVIVFKLIDGELPDYDDKSRVLHLNQLNKIISKIDKAEIDSNSKFFSRFESKNEIEKRLLKSAKELRLCLTHFDKFNI